MRQSRPHPPARLRLLLGALLALPMALAALMGVPASAETPIPSDGNDDISVTGFYAPGGSGCQGAEDAAHCLFWGVRIPDTVAPGREVTVTFEADSKPGEWSWNCSSEEGVAGAAALYTNDDPQGSIYRYGSSGLGLLQRIYDRYTKYGDYSASVDSISCTPSHLRLAYKVDFTGRPTGSYLDLSIGTLVTNPGDQARDYTLKPTLTSTEDATPHNPTATAAKEPASATHATVTTSKQDLPAGSPKYTGRYTATIHNDSTSPLTGFTIAAARTEGKATVTRMSCDLTPFGGQVVTAEGTTTSLEVSGGSASIPGGKEATCEVDLSEVVGRNTISTSVTSQEKTFSTLYEDANARGEATASTSHSNSEVQPPDAMHSTDYVTVDYIVTLTNTTDADGQLPNLTLKPKAPAGLTLQYVEPSGIWWLRDTLEPQADGSIHVPTSSLWTANAQYPLTLRATYAVDTAAITADGWKALGTCDPNDPSKGLNATIDVEGNATIDSSSFPLCTTVTQAKK